MATLNLKDLEGHDKESEKLKITWDNLEKSGFLSSAKVEIAKHKATTKKLIGAKLTGKTIMAVLQYLVDMEANWYNNGAGFREHKTGAAAALGGYVLKVYHELTKLWGFKTNKKWEKRSNYLYRLSNSKMKMDDNQLIGFASLKDVEGSATGIAPSNGGRISSVTVDEPISETDAIKNNFPSISVWNKTEMLIRSNYERYNLNLQRRLNLRDDKEKVDLQTTIWYLANNWGEHPLSVDCDNHFPEEEFIKWVLDYDIDELYGNEELLEELFNNEEWLKKIISHNTDYRYFEETDTLYARMTVFANPNNLIEKKLKSTLLGLRNALEDRDYSAITFYLGLRQQPMVENEWRVYGDDTVDKLDAEDNKFTQEDLESKGFVLKAINYAWDVDYTRVFTCVPTLLYEKVITVGSKTFLDRKVLWDEIIELQAYGGERDYLDSYVDMIHTEITEHYKKLKTKTMYDFKIAIKFDDNNEWLIRDLCKKEWDFNFSAISEKPDKIGLANGILPRQDMVRSGIESGILVTHPANQNLIYDMRVMVRENLTSQKRDTGGKNYLDRWDPAEYGANEFSHLIWQWIKNTIRR